MKVTVNQKVHEITKDTTVRELLTALKYKNAAVLVNDRKLLMSEYDTTRLREQDEIKIIRILGGG